MGGRASVPESDQHMVDKPAGARFLVIQELACASVDPGVQAQENTRSAGVVPLPIQSAKCGECWMTTRAPSSPSSAQVGDGMGVSWRAAGSSPAIRDQYDSLMRTSSSFRMIGE